MFHGTLLGSYLASLELWANLIPAYSRRSMTEITNETLGGCYGPQLAGTLINAHIFPGRRGPGKIFRHAIAHQDLPGVPVLIRLQSRPHGGQQSFAGVLAEFEAGALVGARVPWLYGVVQAAGSADYRHRAVL